MPMQPTFLNWNEPCLPQAARWLLSQSSQQDQSQEDWAGTDLSGFTLVLPSARAGRRLLEILVEQTVGRAMTPPRITTLSRLPELLYHHDLPRADELMAWLLRAESINLTPPAELAALLPHPPGKDDALGQLTLAQDIQKIADELASHKLTFASVAAQITSLMDFDDHARWDVLANLDERYHQLLAQRGLIDTNLARQEAIDAAQNGTPETDATSAAGLGHTGHLVLIATTDLPPIVAEMLEHLQSNVDILIHASEDQSPGFDAQGRLIHNWWENQYSELPKDHVHLLDQPADQAYQIARIISQLKPQDSSQNASALPRPDQITVGLGDQNMAPLITRTLECTGVPSRNAAGRVINQSPPAVLLQSIAALLSRHTTHELAQTLRCPAVEAQVRSAMGEQGSLLLTHLDKYIKAHLPHRLTDDFLEDEQEINHAQQDAAQSPSQTVAMAWRTLMGFVPEDWNEPQPLNDWSVPIAQLLQTFFGQRDLKRFDPDDAILIRAIQAIAQALEQQANAPQDLCVLSRFTLAQAIQLLGIQIAGQLLPPESGEPAVELLRWPELQLDDAPHLIITGFNEGNIPQHTINHWLLPDTLRQQLGLTDNRHRYVRDLYMLKAMAHSRTSMDVIVGRTSAKSEPLTPSRLLLAASPEELPAWVEQFYDDKHASLRAELLISPGRDNTFEVPRPMPLDHPITNLSVTAFRDYISCPYRFYLKHVLKLRPLDDRAVEMDAMTFGVMAHDVLQQFATSPQATSSNPETIQDYLAQTLQERITSKFGSKPPGVIHIQQEIMRQRLNSFAYWQARQVQLGWTIQADLTEKRLQTTLQVDGQPFAIHGRIDRCDHHPQLGHRLLDYKTADAHRNPEKNHRKGNGTWLDLQLPLYHELARSLDLQGDIQLGYVLLPKDLRHTGLSPANWDSRDIDSAVDTAHDIIRNIRNEVFWPPTSTPREDEFAGICMDHCLNKPEHGSINDNIIGQGKINE